MTPLSSKPSHVGHGDQLVCPNWDSKSNLKPRRTSNLAPELGRKNSRLQIGEAVEFQQHSGNTLYPWSFRPFDFRYASKFWYLFYLHKLIILQLQETERTEKKVAVVVKGRGGERERER